MQEYNRISGEDETLAACLYTGFVGTGPLPGIRLTRFKYTISSNRTLLDKVKHIFGEALEQDLPPEHLAWLEEAEQLPEDIELAQRMREVQAKTL